MDSVKEVVLDSVKCHLHKNLIPGQDAPSYDIIYSLLAAKGDDEASRLFNEELARGFFGHEGISVDSAMHYQADSLATSYAADLKEVYDQSNDDTFAFMYTYEQTADVREDSHPGIAAYTMEVTTYLGGAHGSHDYYCLNLNRHTGRAIRRADFFQESKLAEVKHLVEQSLVKRNGCANMDQLVARTGICSLGEVYVHDDNFLLLADSVEFIYNPYEVASWANGTIVTRVAYSELAPCINKDVLPKE